MYLQTKSAMSDGATNKTAVNNSSASSRSYFIRAYVFVPVFLLLLLVVGIVQYKVVLDSSASSASSSLSAVSVLEEESTDTTEHYVNTSKIMRREDFPPPPPSVYHNRTGEAQPGWAKKYFFLPYPNKTAGEKSGCFVHVGKTAGTTIACYLGFKYRGEETFVLPKGRLRDQTVHAFHNWVNDCPDDDDYYLFALRDPVSRMKSWFTYERPMYTRGFGDEWDAQKALFLDCPFPTLNDLAERGLGDPRSHPDVSSVCRLRAFDAIRGYRLFYRHNYYNFHWYLSHIPTDKPLLALRQEFLERDWGSAERVLAAHANDTTPFEIKFPVRNQSKKVTEADKELSREATKNLCKVLCMEIQTYKEILRRAINLSPEDVAASMELLATNCPVETNSSTCDMKLFEKR